MRILEIMVDEDFNADFDLAYNADICNVCKFVIRITTACVKLILMELCKVRKAAKVRNQYSQVPHLIQDTTQEVTKTQLNMTNKSQEVSPFQAGDHKTVMNRPES